MRDPGNPVRRAVSEDATAGSPGIMAELGLDHWIEGELSHGRAPIVPGLCVPGTGIPRIGALTMLVDVIAGQPPSGAVNPTTDISVHMTELRPMASVHIVSRVLKAGRLLAVMEAQLMADDDTEPFAVSLSTFLNRLISTSGQGTPPAHRPLAAPIAERIGARVLAPGTVELPPLPAVRNPHHGTILGGVMAMLVELAAESMFVEAGPVVVTDLDVRFLNRVKVGPALAVANTVMTGPQGHDLAVEVFDSGDGDRMAVYATARVVPAPTGSMLP